MNTTFKGVHALLVGIGGNVPCAVTDAKGLRQILIDPLRCAYFGCPASAGLFAAQSAQKRKLNGTVFKPQGTDS